MKGRRGGSNQTTWLATKLNACRAVETATRRFIATMNAVNVEKQNYINFIVGINLLVAVSIALHAFSLVAS